MTNLIEPGEGVGTLAFSPSSELLATGFGDAGNIRLWDARSGEPRGRLTNHAGLVRQLAFTPNGQRLAVGHASGKVHIWDWTQRSSPAFGLQGRLGQLSPEHVVFHGVLPRGR